MKPFESSDLKTPHELAGWHHTPNYGSDTLQNLRETKVSVARSAPGKFQGYVFQKDPKQNEAFPAREARRKILGVGASNLGNS